MSDREETPLTDSGFDSDARKRKSKSPSTFLIVEVKRAKVEDDNDTEDISKQYKRFQSAPKFNFNSEELYCICRKPDNGTLMISCDGCEEWFHTKCMKIENQHLSLLDKFYCKFCQWKGKGVTHWHRKCRSPDCYKAANTKEQSKYCSEECAIRFLRLKLVGSQNFTKGDMNFVINHCKTHSDLAKLGLEFPELEVVVQLDLEKLSLEVRNMLNENDIQQKELHSVLEAILNSREYLALIKKRTELINEKVNKLVGESEETENLKKSKKKRSKPKKIDLCCFDDRVRLAIDNPTSTSFAQAKGLADSPIDEVFKKEIDEAVLAFEREEHSASRICLEDRRKCLRHNGWYNLLHDKTWKRLTELQAAMEKLKAFRENALREYSISVYEKEESGPQNVTPEIVRPLVNGVV